MAKRRRGRPIDGILLLDKPSGISSNAALQTARRLYFAAKAGHTGSLDPLASGVLPVCFGEATKFSQFLLDSDKAYRATITLGQSTDSGDADGAPLQQCDTSGLAREQVAQALRQFEGEIEQLPSMFSALKHQGQPLYKLARQGKTVERQPRKVTIYQLQLEDFRPGERAEVDIYVHSSKGTYVRSIAEDLGAALGCGGHISSLRRVQAGPFALADCVTLVELEQLKGEEQLEAMDALLLPVDSGLTHFPCLPLDETAAFYILRGQAVRVAGAPQDGLLRMRCPQGRFLGLGQMLDDGRVGPYRLIATD